MGIPVIIFDRYSFCLSVPFRGKPAAPAGRSSDEKTWFLHGAESLDWYDALLQHILYVC